MSIYEVCVNVKHNLTQIGKPRSRSAVRATAKTRDLPLARLDPKHFPMFAGLRRPYQASERSGV
jgi:hypothetical protein